MGYLNGESKRTDAALRYERGEAFSALALNVQQEGKAGGVGGEQKRAYSR